MSDYGVVPDIVSWSTLIKAHAMAGNLEEAFTLLHQMREAGVSPTVRTLNPLIDRCAREERKDMVGRALALMREWDVPKDVVTYNSLLAASIAQGESEHVIDHIFQELRAEGLKPNVVTYNILIDQMGRKGDHDGALAMLEKMEASGIAPNAQTYGHLMESFERNGRPKKALEMFDRMQEQGVPLNPFTVTLVISAYGRLGDTNGVEKMMNLIRERRMTLPPFGVERLVEIYLSTGQSAKVTELLASRLRDGLVLPRRACVGVVLYHLRHGRYEEAMAYLESLPQSRVKLDSRSFFSILRTALNQHNLPLDVPERIWDELERRKIRPAKALEDLYKTVDSNRSRRSSISSHNKEQDNVPVAYSR